MIDVIKESLNLLIYWNFEHNSHLDIASTKVSSKQHARWFCPSCEYSWEATIFSTHKASLKNQEFCLCCNHRFEATLKHIFKRVKRWGTDCTECQATFNVPLIDRVAEAPLAFLTPDLANEWLR